MEGIVIAVIGAISTIAGFFVGRRKRKAEGATLEIQNLSEIINLWKEKSEWQADEIIKLREQVKELHQKIIEIDKKYYAMCENCIYKRTFLRDNQKID